MCFHPIKIRNPSIYINPDIDKPFIEVPCGQCEQCKTNKVNDLVVRAYYQWQDAINLGGFAYFDTLTYSDKSVPRLFGTMIFSRDHLTRFFKRVRIKLSRNGFDVISRLKYIVTTEYGEDERYTKRPHYHIIWFSSVPGLSIHQLYSVCRQVWTNEMHLGWNDKITDVMSHVINRLDGIRYVCKYITKTSKYIERLTSLTERYKLEPDKLSVIMDNVKNIKPFYRASIGFGESILDVKYDQLNAYGVPVYTSSGLTFYPIPKYIKNKLFFDKINHPFKDTKLSKRNTLGVQYLIDHLDTVLDAKELLYKNVLDNENLFNDGDTYYRDYIYQLLDGRSIRDFLVYKNIYKGHLFSELSWHDYKDYFYRWLTDEKQIVSPWYDSFRDFQSRESCKRRFNDFVNDSSHPIIDDVSDPAFFCFDEIDSMFDILIENYQLINEKALIKKENENSRVEELVARFAPRY